MGALAEEYLRRCFFRHARRCYGDGVKEELEDIASDAVEKCLARLDRFQGEELCSPPGSMGSRRMSFGTTTGRGHAEIGSGRKCGRIRVHGGMTPPPDEPPLRRRPLRWVIHQEKLEALHLAMADLPVNDESF